MLRFNFAERKESAYAKYIKPDILFLLFVILSVSAGVYLYTNTIQQQINATQQRIEELRNEIRRLHRVQRKEKELLTIKKEFKRKLNIISQLDRNRKVPKFLYFFANPSNVKDVWLDSLVYSNRNLQIRGGTENISEFPVFLKNVEANLGRVLFKDTERKVYTNRKINFTAVYYNFKFSVGLKNGSVN